MSKRKHVKQQVPIQKSDHRGLIYVSLPVPNPDIIKELAHDDGAVHRYLETTEKLAKLESETILSACKAKYSYRWKILVVVAIVLCFLLGIILGQKISISYDHFGVSTEQSQ